MQSDYFESTSSRRRFLLRGGGTALAAGAALAAGGVFAAPARCAQSLAMTAEGAVDFAYVLSLVPPVLQPPPAGFVPTGVPRARFTFPIEHADVLETFVFQPGELYGTPIEGPISLFYISIDDASITTASEFDADRPEGTFAMCGHVISNPVVSPFGDLTGRSAAVASGFVAGADGGATFKLLGGPIGGSHATFLKEAVGTLNVKRPWQSY